MIKKLTLAILLSSSLFAYNVGDSVDKSVVNQLALKKDKLYLINFFASWCGSCKKELPILNNHASKNNIIGINIDKDASKGKSFVKKMGLNFKVVYDSANDMVKIFNPVGVPAIYFVKNGKIVAQKFGGVDQIDAYLSKTFKEFK